MTVTQVKALPGLREAGDGPVILFLHGWTMRGDLFDDQIARLAGRFHCLAPDLPGHGAARNDEPSIAAAAASVDALLAARDLRDVTLVGWSMGAAIAWRYAADHGAGRLAGIVAVDMSPRIVNDAGWNLGLIGQDEESCAAQARRFRNDWHGSAPAIAAGMFARRKGPPGFPFERAVDVIRDNDPEAMAAMWESLVAADTRAVIPTLEVPLVAAHGAASRVYTAATAIWLAETAPRGVRRTFAASGHSPHLEEPDAFAGMVADFATANVASRR